MAFKAALIAHAPDADPARHRSVVETPKYKLFTVVVSNQRQAISECKSLTRTEGVQSILLCPGFTHRDIAEIAEAVGESVGLCVARSDGPGNRAVMEVLKKEGWFGPKETG